MQRFLMYFPVFILLIFIQLTVAAQPEQVKISKDPRIDELLNKHIQFNEVQGSIPGYRLQIYSGSGNYSKGNAINERSRFMGRYSDVEAYIIFNTPYYIVRVGNFRTRLDAEAFRQKIIEQYPEAYIVRDDIDLPKTE